MSGQNKPEEFSTEIQTSKHDCTSCKLVGAGGCFAGAVYAFYSRSQLPVSNSNRRWLAIIGLGEGVGVCVFCHCFLYRVLLICWSHSIWCLFVV